VGGAVHRPAKCAAGRASLAGWAVPPIGQTSAAFFGRVAVGDGYAGLAFEEEGERVCGFLSDPKIKVLVMGNHGLMAVGETVSEAFDTAYYFERACETYITALATARPLRVLDRQTAAKVADEAAGESTKDGTPSHAKHLSEIRLILDAEGSDRPLIRRGPRRRTGRRRPAVVVMVKEPRPGRVKTRLARGIGSVAAARWFRRTASRRIRDLARDPRWQVILAVSPDREGLASRVWPSGPVRLPQGRGDLGERMARLLRLAGRRRPAVLIGGDIPGATPARIAEAFAALGRADAVFGPAEDGGFWLVGLSPLRAPAAERRMFEGVRWSLETTLAETLAAFRGRRGAVCATLADGDEAESLPGRGAGP